MHQRLQAATTGRFHLDGPVIDYDGPSIGVIIAAADATSAEALLAQADAAMYAAKRARRGARLHH